MDIRKLPFNRTGFLAILGIGLLLGISAFSFWSSAKYKNAEEWKDHSAEVLNLVHELQLSIERAETAQRGYVLTGAESFLQPYSHSIATSKEMSEKLIHLVSDNSDQTRRAKKLSEALKRKAESLEIPIAIAKKGQSQKAMQEIRKGRGQELMVKVREEYADFREEEIRLLKTRTQIAEDDFSIATLIVLKGQLFALFLLIYVTLSLRAEFKRRNTVESELVSERTKAVDASEMKSRFLANMSHEIRTPLNGLIGMSQLLAETELSRDQREAVLSIRESSNFLLSLINQVLDLSKIESGRLQLEEAHFEVRSLIHSARAMVQTLADEKGLAIDVHVGKNVEDFVVGDPLRLRQILLNLLSNSIKFSEKGVISLSVQSIRQKEETSRLRFEVADQGIGMSPESMAKLFKTFSQGDASTTRKYGGSGLGLSISKQLVNLMNGEIKVESEMGKGSRFIFEIELGKAEFSPVDQVKRSSTPAIVGGRVLVAEDNVTNQKVITSMLKSIGCTVEIANNGSEAIQHLLESEFDLILMDGQMPVMDGYEATRKIREGHAGDHNTSIPIIAVTANAIKGDMELCLAAGMNDYIAKPVPKDDLVAKVARWIKNGTATIDPSAIDRLRELDDEDLVREIIKIFLDSSPEIIRKMKQVNSEKNLEELKREAHSFKSTCANVGAQRMREIAARIEKIAHEGDLIVTGDLVNALEREFAVVSKELQKNAA